MQCSASVWQRCAVDQCDEFEAASVASTVWERNVAGRSGGEAETGSAAACRAAIGGAATATAATTVPKAEGLAESDGWPAAPVASGCDAGGEALMADVGMNWGWRLAARRGCGRQRGIGEADDCEWDSGSGSE